MSDINNLSVFDDGRKLLRRVARIRGGFADLTDQLRRAALSIVTNMAEGAGYDSDLQQARFYSIARGSAQETGALLGVLTDLGKLAGDDPVHDLADKVSRKLYRLIRYLRG